MNFETVYAHLGWREINGEWVYLHASGAIGKNGAVEGVSVDAGSALNLYQLTPAVGPDKLLEAIKASFEQNRPGITQRLTDCSAPRVIAKVEDA